MLDSLAFIGQQNTADKDFLQPITAHGSKNAQRPQCHPF
jgi:hypothetical protein